MKFDQTVQTYPRGDEFSSTIKVSIADPSISSRPPQPLIHRLNQNGFVVFLEEQKKDFLGLIRAVRMA
jgi:hypothetical protein